MSRDQFKKVRKFIHFNDNQEHKTWDDGNYKRLQKLRPIIDMLSNTIASIPFEQNHSTDKKMYITIAMYAK